MLLILLGCVLLLFELLAFCIALTLDTDCAKKRKKWKKTKLCWANASPPLTRLLMFICKFPRSLPGIIFCPRQTVHMYKTGHPFNQTHKHKPTAGLTCIFIVFVLPPVWEMNTTHWPSAGKHLVEAVVMMPETSGRKRTQHSQMCSRQFPV